MGQGLISNSGSLNSGETALGNKFSFLFACFFHNLGYELSILFYIFLRVQNSKLPFFVLFLFSSYSHTFEMNGYKN